jgi:arylsulfatase A-like enzyme
MLRTSRHKLSADAKTREPIELYDLTEDPNELHNLVTHADHVERRQQLLNEVLNPLLYSLDTRAW